MFDVQHASPRVGSTVRISKEDMVRGTYAGEIRQLLTERSALAFPQVHLTADEQLAFASTVGEIFLVAGEELQKISLDPEINPVADYTRGAFYWHIDGANDDVPAKATMLNCRILAEEGTGDTMVANTYAAYEDLSDEDKNLISGLRVRHCLESTQRMVNPDPSYAELQRWQAYPSRVHPLVWQHRSGQRSLLIGATAYYVEGMSFEEGRALLCRLKELATQPSYVYRHKWSVGDFLLFDNTGTMHRAAAYDLKSKRLMDRTTLRGEEAIA
ncbi:MAG TPA: TauD/TfdA family dioxygenase [Sphingobium sp.]|uniref:TauD/TfdA dioxygenase family protein n=1 Tax=Sphingobium sp. TaxID=1912891 RepID=UPI002ED39E06